MRFRGACFGRHSTVVLWALTLCWMRYCRPIDEGIPQVSDGFFFFGSVSVLRLVAAFEGWRDHNQNSLRLFVRRQAWRSTRTPSSGLRTLK